MTDVRAVYDKYYGGEKFVRLLHERRLPSDDAGWRAAIMSISALKIDPTDTPGDYDGRHR